MYSEIFAALNAVRIHFTNGYLTNGLILQQGAGVVDMHVDVVVAKYLEDVGWVNQLGELGTAGYRVFIYDKGRDAAGTRARFPGHAVVAMENRGRESSTFLQHIITHYDSLGEYTMFLQGTPFDHCKLSRDQFLDVVRNDPLALRNDRYWYMHDSDGNGGPDHPGLEIASVFRRFIGPNMPNRVRFRAGAQYVVSRDEIRLRTVQYYQELLEHLADNSMHGLNPWSIERLWKYIFNLHDRTV